MRQPDGVRLDFESSMIYLDGVGFPAAVAVLDVCEGVEYPACAACLNRGGCFFGGHEKIVDTAWDDDWSVFVPLENGTLFEVAYDHVDRPQHRRVINAYLRPPRQVRDPNETGEKRSMVMEWYEVCGNEIRYTGRPRVARGLWQWRDCDPSWLAELIPRLAAMPVVAPAPGTPVELIPISDIRVAPPKEEL